MFATTCVVFELMFFSMKINQDLEKEKKKLKGRKNHAWPDKPQIALQTGFKPALIMVRSLGAVKLTTSLLVLVCNSFVWTIYNKYVTVNDTKIL